MELCAVLDRNTSDEADNHQRVCLHAEVLTSIFGKVCEAIRMAVFVSLIVVQIITGQEFIGDYVPWLYLAERKGMGIEASHVMNGTS